MFFLFFFALCEASLLKFTGGRFYPSGYPLPSTMNLIERLGYLSDISLKMKMPVWVAEQLQSCACRRAYRNKCSFRLDPSMPKEEQATLADYKKNKLGLSRGHMSAASNHLDNQQAMKETFYLSSNIVPQNAVLNGGDWLRLERLHQKLAKEYERCPLYIIQGPLWLPNCTTVRMQGPNKLIVPTHFFKAAKLFDGATEASAGFIVPNKPLRTDDDLSKYKVDVRQIELTAGLNLIGIKSLKEIGYPSVNVIHNARVKSLVRKIRESRDMRELRKLVIGGLESGLYQLKHTILIDATRSRGLELHGEGDLVNAILKGNAKYKNALNAILYPKP